MDKHQAAKLLGLTGSEPAVEITQAYQNKLAMVDEKLSSAPTDALKQKLEHMKDFLNQAHKALTSAPPKHSSPLTKTKMADLPGTDSGLTMGVKLESGTTLSGRYQIKDQIGIGGMGAVYHAFDQSKQEDIAIKVLLPALVKNERARERFMDEARISAKLSHPGIVNVFDVQQDGDYLFLTMELLEGQDLRSLMETRKLSRQEFDEEEAKALLSSLLEALSYAHKHTVHRDLKPENIWVSDEGEYKIMDFGIARIMSNSQRTQTGLAMGTAYYMAPEQLKGTSKIDGRADIYALGVLIYEMMTGEVPAGRIKPLKELRKDLSKVFAAAIDHTLEPKPEERFDDAESFLKALNNSGTTLPSFNSKKLAVPAVILIAILGIGGLIGSGSLGGVWDAIKPLDKELVARQQAEAAKLLGEIKSYRKRLENGQRNLKSEVKEAQRKSTGDLKYLQNWQRLTDDYLFEGNDTTELEGLLSQAESLLKADSAIQANVTLLEVRDSYKNLWDQFNAAEDLLKTKESVSLVKSRWQNRKKAYTLPYYTATTLAKMAEDAASIAERDGDFKSALKNWQKARLQWSAIYDGASGEVARIDSEFAAAEPGEWAKAKKLRHVEVYERYLRKYPKSVHIAEVYRGLADAYTYNQKDNKRGFSYLMKSANMGHAPAQNDVGAAYGYGRRGVTENWVEAIKWYRKAALQGNAEGMFSLGLSYKSGRGVTKNYAIALKWYRKAADQGDVGHAQLEVGRMYENGLGVTQDYAKAIKWYRKAADKGLDDGFMELGRMYENGLGVTKDKTKALKWYRKVVLFGLNIAKKHIKRLEAQGYH